MADPDLAWRVDEAECPVQTCSPDGSNDPALQAVLRRPRPDDPAPLVVMLHGGLAPLPLEALRLIALRGVLPNRFLRAGYAVALPTRRARPDAPTPSGAIDDTLRSVASARRRVGSRDLVLFGSSGGGDLALEVAGPLAPVAIVIEEPATSLLTGILSVTTPKRAATWQPDEVWPRDYASRYTDARRAATREVLSRIACPILLAEGDQSIEGSDPRVGVESVLIPELEALGKRVIRQRYAGQAHGFGLLTGAAPGPVADAARSAVERFFEDADRFIRARLHAPPRPLA